MMFTTAQLRAVRVALHRLIADGEHDVADTDVRGSYDKVCAEIRKRDRINARAKAGK